ncbi:hypothetical protein ABZ464_02845 [Streptomyces sp. NPDC005820]|uniref:hypothetical protein n=1 Tax=Streptomyces sp. NPDC005820 TaxID=3157069 RepID=UPI00340430EB
MRNIFARIAARFRKPAPVEVVEIDFGPFNRYTVVLDWAGDNGFLDAPVMHIEAGSRMEAFTAARMAAWDEYAGHIIEIPKGAEYDEYEAEELWYTVAILEGWAVEAAA